jgi:hypothetical protein
MRPEQAALGLVLAAYHHREGAAFAPFDTRFALLRMLIHSMALRPEHLDDYAFPKTMA